MQIFNLVYMLHVQHNELRPATFQELKVASSYCIGRCRSSPIQFSKHFVHMAYARHAIKCRDLKRNTHSRDIGNHKP